jgi:hypothetical protein
MCEHVASFSETILPIARNWEKLESVKEGEGSVNAVSGPVEEGWQLSHNGQHQFLSG